MAPTVQKSPVATESSAAEKNPKRGQTKKLNQATAGRRRSRLPDDHALLLASHVTERDRRIAVDCYEHHVLTTDQISRLYFPKPRGATARLQTLYDLRVLDRFRPSRKRGEGTLPYHWVLDEGGALLVADHKGIEQGQLHYSRADALNLAASRNLTHHVEGNEFFVRLAVESSAAGGALSEWYGVRTLARLLGGVAVPDGYGVLNLPDHDPLHLLLELDRGTESSRVLQKKATSYAEILPHSTLRDLRPLVIFAVPSDRRAQTASSAVSHSGAPVVVVTWSAASRSSLLRAVIAASERARVPFEPRR